MNAWMNSNAGAAVMVSSIADNKAAARSTVSFLLNCTSLCPPFQKSGAGEPHCVVQRHYRIKHRVLGASPKWPILVLLGCARYCELRRTPLVRSSQNSTSTHLGE